MVAVTYLLVLACAWSAAAVAIPGLGEACIYIQTGQLVGKGLQLSKTFLKDPIPDWKVLIPDISQCPYGLLGASALVCDYDVAPDAHFESLNIIFVHRNGGLAAPGTVTPTVYCALSQHQNNQPSLQDNQLLLSDHLPWQSNQNIAHLSPLPLSSSLPSVGIASRSSLGQFSNNLWGQASLPSLKVVPLSQGQSSLSLSPLSSSVPKSAQSPILLGQWSQHLSGQSPLLVGQSSQHLFGNSPKNLIASL